MAEPYKSKYSGAQIDAAVRSMGLIPAIYVSYAEYKANLDILNSAVNNLSDSFNKFFAGINFNGGETFKNMFDSKSTALENTYNTFTTTMETKFNSLKADWDNFAGVYYEQS